MSIDMAEDFYHSMMAKLCIIIYCHFITVDYG
jgi:hypothetical protein